MLTWCSFMSATTNITKEYNKQICNCLLHLCMYWFWRKSDYMRKVRCVMTLLDAQPKQNYENNSMIFLIVAKFEWVVSYWYASGFLNYFSKILVEKTPSSLLKSVVKGCYSIIVFRKNRRDVEFLERNVRVLCQIPLVFRQISLVCFQSWKFTFENIFS